MHAKDRNVATCGAARNRFEYFSLHAYVLRFPRLKCPTAVSAAEISAAVNDVNPTWQFGFRFEERVISLKPRLEPAIASRYHEGTCPRPP